MTPRPTRSIPQVTQAILSRKGVTRTADVPDDVRTLLNLGLIETANLSEWLIVDQLALAECVFGDAGWNHLLTDVRDELSALKTPTAPKKTTAVAAVLNRGMTTRSDRSAALKVLKSHRSDIVRSWAALMIGNDERLRFEAKLKQIRPLAADENMGVREMAWMAIRDDVFNDPSGCIAQLANWTTERDARVRRFASEATRPCGVWCRHIPELKQRPEIGLPVLHPLRSDDSKYVRDSVANWLNDASKSRPEWVQKLCTGWLKESSTNETRLIVHRALRTLRKNSEQPTTELTAHRSKRADVKKPLR
jgi:3-methyladenine DNA glycosylase AlkC